MEWVNGELIEKTGMTIRHAIVQGRLIEYWRRHANTSGQGGEVLAEAPCRTRKQGLRPDVAYMTPELIAQFERTAALPQSYPLIAEVASPDDSAEGLFAKAIEYLESGCEEVWLIFPEAQLVMVKTQEQAWQLFTPGQTIRTQNVLKEFEIAIATLFN
jgi:Uma2 family endonuclease